MSGAVSVSARGSVRASSVFVSVSSWRTRARLTGSSGYRA